MSNTITPTVFYRTLNVEEFGGQSSLSTVSGLGNSLVSIISSDLLFAFPTRRRRRCRGMKRECPAFGGRRHRSGARSNASGIPGRREERRTRAITPARVLFACHVQSRGAFPFYALLRDFAYSAARSACPPRRRILSELAPVMTTTLSLIPSIKSCVLPSIFQCQISFSDAFFLKSQAIDFNFSCDNSKLWDCPDCTDSWLRVILV